MSHTSTARQDVEKLRTNMSKETPWSIKEGRVVLCDRADSCLSKSNDFKFSKLIVKDKHGKTPSGLFGYLPWIGKNYFSFNKKLIVVGESYYKSENSPQYDDAYGRALIADWICRQPAGETHRQFFQKETETYERLFNAIWPVRGGDVPHRESVASSIVYFNLVQRCLTTPAGKTPQDFIRGWASFFRAVELLRPQLCIFNGFQSKIYLQDGIAEAERTAGIGINMIEGRVVPSGEKINNCWTRPSVRLKIDGRHKITLLWMKHSCRSFNPEKWRKYFLMFSKDYREWIEGVKR